jgi:aerobic carbon-monoxide dehydrogenase medium subunit
MLTPFRYCQPRTVAEASETLLRFGPHARVLAGGTDLLPRLERQRATAETVVALPLLEDLRSLSGSPAAGLRIGSLVTLSELAHAPLVRRHWRVLFETAMQMATPAVRTLATLGGNICAGQPMGDLAAAGLALDAEVEISGPGGERRIPLDKFLTEQGSLDLAAGEIMVALHVPPIEGRAAYRRFSVRSAADVVLANVAVCVSVGQVRVVVGGHGLRPARARAAEAMLASGTAAEIPAAAAAAADWSCPAEDLRASRRYRRKLIRVLLERSLTEVLAPS